MEKFCETFFVIEWGWWPIEGIECSLRVFLKNLVLIMQLLLRREEDSTQVYRLTNRKKRGSSPELLVDNHFSDNFFL